MSHPCRKLRTARYTGLKSSVMLPLRLRMMLRCNTDMMATGHSANRSTVGVLSGPVRGPNAARIQSRRPVRVDSAAVTSAPYTGARARRKAASGRAVRVGVGQFAAVEVADQRRHGAAGEDAGAVADALPHHPLAGGVGVDDAGRGRRYAVGADDRVVLHTEQQHVDLEGLRCGRRRAGGPVHALDHVEGGDGTELRVELAPGDDEFTDPVRG